MYYKDKYYIRAITELLSILIKNEECRYNGDVKRLGTTKTFAIDFIKKEILPLKKIPNIGSVVFRDKLFTALTSSIGVTPSDIRVKALYLCLLKAGPFKGSINEGSVKYRFDIDRDNASWVFEFEDHNTEVGVFRIRADVSKSSEVKISLPVSVSTTIDSFKFKKRSRKIRYCENRYIQPIPTALRTIARHLDVFMMKTVTVFLISSLRIDLYILPYQTR